MTANYQRSFASNSTIISAPSAPSASSLINMQYIKTPQTVLYFGHNILQTNYYGVTGRFTTIIILPTFIIKYFSNTLRNSDPESY